MKSAPLVSAPFLVALLSGSACDRAAPAVAPSTDRQVDREARRDRDEPGACLRVNDVPVTPAEVDRLADDVMRLYPEYTRPHARRLALTNEFFPRLALRHGLAEAWAAARAACAACQPEGGAPWSQEGTWRTIGLGLWSQARAREIGTWSEPVEGLGRWVRIRLDERLEAEDPQGEVLRLSLHVFPFLDPAELGSWVESSVDASRLEILAPEWGQIVPESWKYRMKAPDRLPR